MPLFKHGFTVNNNLISLYVNNLSCVFIHKVLVPSLENSCGKGASYALLQVGLVNLNLICKAKDVQNIFVAIESYSPKQCGYR